MHDNLDVLDLKSVHEIPLESLIVASDFMYAWNNQDQDVVDYVSQHIHQIEEYAYLMKNVPPTMLNHRCLNILHCQNPKIYRSFFQNKKFFDVILEYVQNIHKYRNDSQKNYFDSIAYYTIHSGYAFFNLFDTKKFFGELLKHMYLEYPVCFMKQVLSHMNFRSISIFRNLNITDLLIQKFLSNDTCSDSAILIISESLSNDYFMRISVDPLNSNIHKIIEVTFNEKKRSGIILLKHCFQIAESSRSRSSWKGIGKKISSYIDFMIDRVENNIGIFEDSIIRFLNEIFTYEPMKYKEELIKLSKILIDFFIQYPGNTFIVNHLVLSLEILVANHPTYVLHAIKGTELIEFITSAFQDPDSLNTCNWGQYKNIAARIHPYINVTENPEWNTYVLPALTKNRKSIAPSQETIDLLTQLRVENCIEDAFEKYGSTIYFIFAFIVLVCVIAYII